MNPRTFGRLAEQMAIAGIPRRQSTSELSPGFRDGDFRVSSDPRIFLNTTCEVGVKKFWERISTFWTPQVHRMQSWKKNIGTSTWQKTLRQYHFPNNCESGVGEKQEVWYGVT